MKLIDLLKEIKVLNPILRHFELLSPPISPQGSFIYRLKGTGSDSSVGCIFMKSPNESNKLVSLDSKYSKEFNIAKELLDERNIPYEIENTGNKDSLVVTIG